MVPLVKLVLSFALLWYPAAQVEARAVRSISDPPPVTELAQTARYIIHNADWISIATISTRDAIKGDAFASLKSTCDGPINNSTGYPYLYITDKDITAIDILANNKVTILASLAQTHYCKDKHYDPQDPRCSKVMISATVTKVLDPTEEEFARNALFARHPPMKHWPTDHGFYVARVNPTQILLLNNFGGLKTVSIDDYFNAKLSNNDV